MVKDPMTGEMRLENKAERFRRLANRRLSGALDRMDQLRNLANVNQYTYSKEQADEVLRALRDGIELVRMSFTQKVAKEERFRL
jgi:hypothetical protein